MAVAGAEHRAAQEAREKLAMYVGSNGIGGAGVGGVGGGKHAHSD